eukprot:Nk52_evm25s32 gene=Nk52_evmTU25s32
MVKSVFKSVKEVMRRFAGFLKLLSEKRKALYANTSIAIGDSITLHLILYSSVFTLIIACGLGLFFTIPTNEFESMFMFEYKNGWGHDARVEYRSHFPEITAGGINIQVKEDYDTDLDVLRKDRALAIVHELRTLYNNISIDDTGGTFKTQCMKNTFRNSSLLECFFSSFLGILWPPGEGNQHLISNVTAIENESSKASIYAKINQQFKKTSASTLLYAVSLQNSSVGQTEITNVRGIITAFALKNREAETAFEYHANNLCHQNNYALSKVGLACSVIGAGIALDEQNSNYVISYKEMMPIFAFFVIVMGMSASVGTDSNNNDGRPRRHWVWTIMQRFVFGMFVGVLGVLVLVAAYGYAHLADLVSCEQTIVGVVPLFYSLIIQILLVTVYMRCPKKPSFKNSSAGFVLSRCIHQVVYLLVSILTLSLKHYISDDIEGYSFYSKYIFFLVPVLTILLIPGTCIILAINERFDWCVPSLSYNDFERTSIFAFKSKKNNSPSANMDGRSDNLTGKAQTNVGGDDSGNKDDLSIAESTDKNAFQEDPREQTALAGGNDGYNVNLTDGKEAAGNTDEVGNLPELPQECHGSKRDKKSTASVKKMSVLGSLGHLKLSNATLMSLKRHVKDVSSDYHIYEKIIVQFMFTRKRFMLCTIFLFLILYGFSLHYVIINVMDTSDKRGIDPGTLLEDDGPTKKFAEEYTNKFGQPNEGFTVINNLNLDYASLSVQQQLKKQQDVLRNSTRTKFRNNCTNECYEYKSVFWLTEFEFFLRASAFQIVLNSALPSMSATLASETESQLSSVIQSSIILGGGTLHGTNASACGSTAESAETLQCRVVMIPFTEIGAAHLCKDLLLGLTASPSTMCLFYVLGKTNVGNMCSIDKDTGLRGALLSIESVSTAIAVRNSTCGRFLAPIIDGGRGIYTGKEHLFSVPLYGFEVFYPTLRYYLDHPSSGTFQHDIIWENGVTGNKTHPITKSKFAIFYEDLIFLGWRAISVLEINDEISRLEGSEIGYTFYEPYVKLYEAEHKASNGKRDSFISTALSLITISLISGILSKSPVIVVGGFIQAMSMGISLMLLDYLNIRSGMIGAFEGYLGFDNSLLLMEVFPAFLQMYYEQFNEIKKESKNSLSAAPSSASNTAGNFVPPDDASVNAITSDKDVEGQQKAEKQVHKIPMSEVLQLSFLAAGFPSFLIWCGTFSILFYYLTFPKVVSKAAKFLLMMITTAFIQAMVLMPAALQGIWRFWKWLKEVRAKRKGSKNRIAPTTSQLEKANES